jgi:hypothetical protein
MRELIKDKKLTLRHEPGKGAWTYHLVIPGTGHMAGSWGKIKVSGTIDGYAFKNRNLAPVTGADKMMSVNGTIRKAIQKGGGDEVLVTMYQDADNKLTTGNQVLECFSDADVLQQFKSLEKQEQEKIIDIILSQADEDSQEKRILDYLRKFS